MFELVERILEEAWEPVLKENGVVSSSAPEVPPCKAFLAIWRRTRCRILHGFRSSDVLIAINNILGAPSKAAWVEQLVLRPRRCRDVGGIADPDELQAKMELAFPLLTSLQTFSYDEIDYYIETAFVLGLLQGLPKLANLTLKVGTLPAALSRPLDPLPALRYLRIEARAASPGLLNLLQSAVNLHELDVRAARFGTSAGLVRVVPLPSKLRTLAVTLAGPNCELDGLLAVVPSFTSLTHLRVDVVEAQLPALLAVVSSMRLKTLSITSGDLTTASLIPFLDIPSLRTLALEAALCRLGPTAVEYFAKSEARSPGTEVYPHSFFSAWILPRWHDGFRRPDLERLVALAAEKGIKVTGRALDAITADDTFPAERARLFQLRKERGWFKAGEEATFKAY
ncbi:hypothetical protein JCM8097_004790 [Rhodosporidiobolus ruineniae]